jgi:thioredoxin 1
MEDIMKSISCMLIVMLACASIAYASSPQDVPIKDMATVVDLGAKTCIPCKMMVPVLDAMEKQYQGKVAVVFIDVRETPEQATKFGIRAIPTQIFFDKTGKEVYRHEGFLDEKPFSEMLDKLLAN